MAGLYIAPFGLTQLTMDDTLERGTPEEAEAAEVWFTLDADQKATIVRTARQQARAGNA